MYRQLLEEQYQRPQSARTKSKNWRKVQVLGKMQMLGKRKDNAADEFPAAEEPLPSQIPSQAPGGSQAQGSQEHFVLGEIGDDQPPNELEKYLPREHAFARRKLQNLLMKWRFYPSMPWYVPEEEIRAYYGEKIALYFTFLSFYSMSLLPIAVVSILAGMAQNVFNWDSKNYVGSLMFYGLFKVFWINSFIFGWFRKEKVFAVIYGQNTSQANQDDTQSERPGFIGNYQRSLVDDNLNSQDVSIIGQIVTFTFSFTLLIMTICIYFFLVIYLFHFTSKQHPPSRQRCRRTLQAERCNF